MSENLIIKLDWNKETTPPPSITDLKNFVSAFEMLFAEKQYKTEVEVREGSAILDVKKIWDNVGNQIFATVVATFISNSIENPSTIGERKASHMATQITNCYHCTINNYPVYPRPQPSDLVLSGVEYMVITHTENTDIKYNEQRNVEKSTIKKTEAFIEITSGELKGRRYRVKTPLQFVDRNVTYIASFSLKNDKLKMIDEPMTITQR